MLSKRRDFDSAIGLGLCSVFERLGVKKEHSDDTTSKEPTALSIA